MFLCSHNGVEFVTNAPEPDLKLCARRNPGFTYREIYFAPAESIKYHSPGPDADAVEKFPKTRVKPAKPQFSTTEIDDALSDFFPEEEELSL